MLVNNNEKINLSDLYIFIFIFGLTLYLIDFYGNVGYYIFIIIAFGSFLFLPFIIINKLITINLFILTGFGISFSIIMINNDYISLIYVPAYILLPSISLIMGFLIGERKDSVKLTTKIILFIMISLTLFILLSYLRTLNAYGTLDSASRALDGRAIANFWNIKIRIKATAMTLKLVLGLSLIPLVFASFKYEKKRYIILVKLLITISFIVSIMIALQMGSRTSIIVSIFSFLVFYLIFEKLSIKKLTRMISGCFLLVIVWLLYKFNFLNFEQWWKSTPVYSRFESSGIESGRTLAWEIALKNFFEHPLGGKKIPLNLNYAHNIWLDVLYDTGWITTLLLILFTFINIYVLYLFFISDYSSTLKGFILLSFLGLYLLFMSEPILSGSERSFFVFYCFLYGIVLGLIIKSKKKRIDSR